MNLSRIDRLFVDIPVTATDRDGQAVTLTALDVAALPPRHVPDDETVWTETEFTDGKATILLAGPDADPTDALAIPRGGADLWVRVTDTPEILTAKAGRVTIA